MAIENEEKQGYVVIIYKPTANAHAYLSNYDDTYGRNIWSARVDRHVFETEGEAAKVALELINDPKYAGCLILPVNTLFEAHVDELLS